MKQFERKQIRAVLLEAVAFGNYKTSCFLHGTMDLACAKRIHRERSNMYSNWMIRWPMTDDPQVIDLSNLAAQSQWLREEDGDSELSREHLAACRAFASKDKEVVVMQRPKFHKVEVWDFVREAWRRLDEAGFVSEGLTDWPDDSQPAPFVAATSQTLAIPPRPIRPAPQPVLSPPPAKAARCESEAT